MILLHHLVLRKHTTKIIVGLICATLKNELWRISEGGFCSQ